VCETVARLRCSREGSKLTNIQNSSFTTEIDAKQFAIEDLRVLTAVEFHDSIKHQFQMLRLEEGIHFHDNVRFMMRDT
jgi:hypothetical protein